MKITNIDLANLTSTKDGCVGVDNVEVLNDAALPADVMVPAATTDAPEVAADLAAASLGLSPLATCSR